MKRDVPLGRLQPQDKLPDVVVVHPELVVTRRSGAAILKQIVSGKSTKALRNLMSKGD